jgi:hypothetical protein
MSGVPPPFNRRDFSLKMAESKSTLQAGLPDGIFSTQKFQFG